MSDEAVRKPNVLICTRCGHEIPDPGNRWDYGGKLIEHMETAHTPHAVEALDAATWDGAIELLRKSSRNVQVSPGGVGWVPSNTIAGAIRLLEHHRPEEQERRSLLPKEDA